MANVLLPPPFKGQNDQYPIIAISSPYCERMENFNNLDGSLKIRQGNDLFASTTVANYYGRGLHVWDATTAELYATTTDFGTNFRIYDITTGSFVLDDTSAAGAGNDVVSFFYNNLLIFCDSANNTTYNGSAFVDGAFTYSGSFFPYGGTEYKTRAYILSLNTTVFGYSGIDVTSGALTEVDLADQISYKAYISMIRPISMTQNLTAESVLSFIFSSGEILVYQGSFPNAPNWGRISRFKISKPIWLNAFVEAKGDSILLTESEILSLRNLFVSGYDKEKDEGIGSAISKRWRQCMQAYLNSGSLITTGVLYRYVKGVYDEKNDRIVISLPKYVDPDTGLLVENTLFQLIYDFNLGAWYEYVQRDSSVTSPIVTSAAYYNDFVYIMVVSDSSQSSMQIMKLDSLATFLDDQLDGTGTVAIDYRLKTAPLPISKFGANAISGVEVICKSDLYPQTNYKFIADLGRQESGSQTIPAQGTSVAKPMMNVGIQGAITAQLQISGSSVSSTVGLELYGFNVWYEGGASGSR